MKRLSPEEQNKKMNRYLDGYELRAFDEAKAVAADKNLNLANIKKMIRGRKNVPSKFTKLFQEKEGVFIFTSPERVEELFKEAKSDFERW